MTTTNLPPEPLSAGAPAAAPEEGEDDLLASFFSEVTATVPNKPSTAQVEQEKRAALLTDKYLKQDLGSPMDQYTRLTEGNYKWRNLNPYETLQLGIDATVEDIKYRCGAHSRAYPVSMILTGLVFVVDTRSYRRKCTRTNFAMRH